MQSSYIAHISEDGTVQSIIDHAEKTAALSADFAVSELKEICGLLGTLHDIGKYSAAFQRRIRGSSEAVEHSICGAKEAPAVSGANSPLTLLLQLCIAGHHTGLPDCGTVMDASYETTLYGRLKRKCEDYSAFRSELKLNAADAGAFQKYLLEDCTSIEDVVEKFSFLVRYCFSCLTDADSLDTRAATAGEGADALRFDCLKCLSSLEDRFSQFRNKTELQLARTRLQMQAIENIRENAEIYLMNMPTGSGKTLAGLRCALERMKASKGKLKRLIYVIPYNSIIDQTADIFEELFSSHTDILRHQSSFVYDDLENVSEDYRSSAKYACENWDAGIVITTAVQFFESLYGDKRSQLRKIHNMAESIIVFDEAHLMPREYLEPCLRGISYITKYLHSEALFLTATMPDFKSLFERFAVSGLHIRPLITDTSDFRFFRKCRYYDLGKLCYEELVQKAGEYGASLIVMNSKNGAADVFKLCTGEKYYLSTYLTAFDRSAIIGKIREALKCLRDDFPDPCDIPPERRITVVSTSLIEAGVDLDFEAAFRELTGLDSILQTGGRCNREGLRPNGDVYVFEGAGQKAGSIEQELTRGIIKEFDDISSPAAIEAYYSRLFGINTAQIHEKAISSKCRKINMIPFRTYSERFQIIEDGRTVSVAVCRDDHSRALYEQLRNTGRISSRKIQKYCCTVYRNQFEELKKQRVLDDYGSGVFFLTDASYYDNEMGIRFEGKDYII